MENTWKLRVEGGPLSMHIDDDHDDDDDDDDADDDDPHFQDL